MYQNRHDIRPMLAAGSRHHSFGNTLKITRTSDISRSYLNSGHFVNAPSQWETTLHCNVVSHWLGTFIKWSLYCISLDIHVRIIHDDVIKWKHFPRYWPFVRGIHRSSVNSPHKGQCRGALMFSLICTRINGWVNNGEAGDLRRHRAHHDINVMTGEAQYRGLSARLWLALLHWRYHSLVPSCWYGVCIMSSWRIPAVFL